MPVYVTVLYIDQSPRQVKLGLTIGVNDTIGKNPSRVVPLDVPLTVLLQFPGDLRQMLSRDTGIDVSQLLLTEIDGLTFKKTFRDSQQVSCLKPAAAATAAVDKSKKGAAAKAAASPAAAAAESGSESSLYCIEMPRHREDSEDDGAFIVLTWVNVLKEGPIEKRSVRFERHTSTNYQLKH